VILPMKTSGGGNRVRSRIAPRTTQSAAQLLPIEERIDRVDIRNQWWCRFPWREDAGRRHRSLENINLEQLSAILRNGSNALN
jgi:hypothetical protein